MKIRLGTFHKFIYLTKKNLLLKFSKPDLKQDMNIIEAVLNHETVLNPGINFIKASELRQPASIT